MTLEAVYLIVHFEQTTASCELETVQDEAIHQYAPIKINAEKKLHNQWAIGSKWNTNRIHDYFSCVHKHT